jgi:catechol 2,3-dioxygenase-like lactoylglutathione lyase family enzyme
MGGRTLAGMATLRMDHVSVVVDDLAAATAFFVELGLEPEGEGEQRVEGDWVDRINAIDGVRVDIAMLRTPDGHNRLELTTFHHPAVIRTDPTVMPPNALGLRSVMFEVDDIDDTISRLRRHGGELVGTVEDYETYYRLCYLRGPAGIIVSLAQRID